MKRTRVFGGSAALIVVVLSACGGSAPSTLPAADFVSQMNDVCRTATRSLRDLDPSDDSYFDDVLDVIQTGQDDFDKLTPPKSLEDDFNDYVDSLDSRAAQIKKLQTALADGDQDKAATIASKLDDINDDSNDLADSIGADRCKDVGGDAVAIDTTSPTTTPVETTPNTPFPIDTTQPTEPPITEPVTTDSGTTSTGSDALDAAGVFTAPDGYQWEPPDLEGIQTPALDPVLGPVLGAYYFGVLQSTADQSEIGIYVTALTEDTVWTPEQLSAYYDFELVGDGTDVTTPTLGLAGKVKPNAIDGFDGAAVTFDGFGIAALATTGTDLLTAIDQFVQAQSG